MNRWNFTTVIRGVFNSSIFGVDGSIILPASIRAKLLYAVAGSSLVLPGKTDPSYAAIYAAVNDGSGFWYDSNGDPVAHLVSEILAEIRTNTWNIWCNNNGRLMIFAKTLLYSEAAIVERYLLGIRPPVNAPPTLSDVVLHYDADKSELLELTGGASPLNYNVLSPQYELQPDGSYVNVGARPAVDTFDDGFVGLRSCGAVTNLLATGKEDFATWTIAASAAITKVSNIYRYSITATTSRYFQTTITVNAGSVYTIILRAAAIPSSTKIITQVIGGSTQALPELTLNNTVTDLIWSFTASASEVVVIRMYDSSGSIGDRAYLYRSIITATSYPVPYVPPGVTQPASNATATGGTWFTNALNSDLWKSLTGSPLTLATRIKMGVGSGDLIGNSVANSVVSCSSTSPGVDFDYFRGSTIEVNSPIITSSDGVTYPSKLSSWPRNSIIRRFLQVNTSGTQFRVGYMIEGTHIAIQWSAWGTFDGSFNPSTLYRLMLGYNNAYLMWFNKITVWKRQVPDDELAVAWL